MFRLPDPGAEQTPISGIKVGTYSKQMISA